MDKLLWVLLPIGLAGLLVGVLAWRGRLPPRPMLNVAFSLLLLVYLLITAGLGIFWVANQHLPVFDWHYVFGYALLLLLLVHLGFNLRQMLFHLRRGRSSAQGAPAPAGRRPALGALGVLGLGAAAGLGYFVGLRHGHTELRIDAGAGSGTDDGITSANANASATALAVVGQFQAFSTHTRGGVVRRAPGADWGAPPPPFKPPREGLHLALPAPGSRQTPTAATGGLDKADLANLLWHTAGVSARSGGIHFRTSPSSGALFATELYVLTLDVDGVAPGLWHYDVPGQALVQLAAGAAQPLLAAVGALPTGSLALVVATAVFRRSGHKYRDRTYRYVLGDLGHALENLRVAARHAGTRATLLQAFDEAGTAKVLGIDEQEEGVLAMMLLQRHQAEPLPPLSTAAWHVPDLAGARPATLDITDAIHRATSLRAAAPPRAGVSPPGREPAPGPGGVSSAWKLLKPADSRVADPLALIASRRSVRRYSPAALALTDLSAVLATMARPGPLLSNAVRTDVVALRVDGLDAGAWRHHAVAHALERRLHDAEHLRRRARAAGLDQDVIGGAAAVIVLSVDRAAFAADPAGAARGYRHAFLESGLMGERVYLEAGARGLGVCAVGAFYDDEAAALVGNDPAREWVLHFAALGLPA